MKQSHFCFFIYKRLVKKLNDRSKERMLEQKLEIVRLLNEVSPGIKVIQDEMSEYEQKKFSKSKYHAFVLQMGDFESTENILKLNQSIIIDYYSENRDDVDEVILDVISLIKSIKAIYFVRTQKVRARVKDTQRFVDVVSLEFVRGVRCEC